MKKLFLALFILSITVVSCPGQSLRMTWEAPAIYDSLEVAQFILYKWEADSSTTNYALFDSLVTISYIQGQYYYEYRTWFDPRKIIAGGVCAEDIRGRRSNITYTKFYDRPSDIPKNGMKK